MELIEKGKVIAEIEKLYKEKIIAEIGKLYKEGYKFLPFNIVERVDDFKDDLLTVLDTLSTVKKVDLEKEARHYLLHEHSSPLTEIMHLADLKAEIQYNEDIENAFKRGFELGLKTQKGEW